MAINQLSVFMENRAGQLAEITETIANSTIDMRAINISETENFGVLRLIVDKPKLGAEILGQHGYIVKETPVVAMAVPDRPGGLNEAVRLIAEKGINIEYMYSVFGHREGLAYMIFRVDDTEGLEKALADGGFKTAKSEELGIQ